MCVRACFGTQKRNHGVDELPYGLCVCVLATYSKEEKKGNFSTCQKSMDKNEQKINKNRVLLFNSIYTIRVAM